MTDVLLYHFPLSFSSQIVRLALMEKEIPWRSVLVDIGPSHENFEPWYMEINDRGVVPTLAYDGVIVTDAVQILGWLDEHFHWPSLQPESLPEQREMQQWIDLQQGFPERELSYGTLSGFVGRMARRNIKRRAKILKRLLDANPKLSEAYRRKIEDVEAWYRAVRDPARVQGYVVRAEALLDKLERHIDGREWLVGSTYTRADLVWTVLLARLDFLGFSYFWKNGRRPAVDAYYRRVRARPAFKLARIYTRPAPLVVARSLVRAYWGRLLVLLLLGMAAVVFLSTG